MSLNFSKTAVAAAVNPSAGAPQRNGDNEPKAEVYLNVGITLPIQQEDGTTENVFVSLPFGLAIDTMNEAQMRGSSASYHMLVQAKNQLLAALKEQAEQLAPGEEGTIDLEVQMRRVGAAAAPKPGENPLIAAMSSRLKVVK